MVPEATKRELSRHGMISCHYLKLQKLVANQRAKKGFSNICSNSMIVFNELYAPQGRRQGALSPISCICITHIMQSYHPLVNPRVPILHNCTLDELDLEWIIHQDQHAIDASSLLLVWMPFSQLPFLFYFCDIVKAFLGLILGYMRQGKRIL